MHRVSGHLDLETQPLEIRNQAAGLDDVRLRVEARGYASNRSAVLGALKAGFEGFAWFKDEGARIEDLSTSEDDQLKVISERTMALIEELDWTFGGDQPSREEVELAALSVIYGK